VLDPSTPQLVTGVGKQAFQEIKRLFYVAQQRINAGDVILDQDVIGIDCQSSRRPFSGALFFAKNSESISAEVSRSGIFGVTGECTLCAFNASSRGMLAIAGSTE
jgi:hypothetical protein